MVRAIGICIFLPQAIKIAIEGHFLKRYKSDFISKIKIFLLWKPQCLNKRKIQKTSCMLET